MLKQTSDSVCWASCKDRFQPMWCNSQQSFLSEREKRNTLLYLICVDWLVVSLQSWLKTLLKHMHLIYLPLWPQQKHFLVYIYCKRHHSVQKSWSSKKNKNILLRLRVKTYLRDSMPFFAAFTKNGNFSILVMSTTPPLLLMTPKWIAALQILDCWNSKNWTLIKTYI